MVQKRVNYHWIDGISDTFTSVKESSSLGEIFLFREFEKNSMMTLGGFLFRIRFYESKKMINLDSTPFS